MSASTSSQPTPAPPAPAPPSTSVLFARGVLARLALWPALRIAVDHGWGGPSSASKRTWIASVLVDAFEEQTPAPDAPYVEEQLLQIMEDEFETVLEDGSVEIVARDVVRMWEEVQAGSEESVRRFEQQAEGVKGRKLQVEEAPGDESDWEDESGGESMDDEDGAEDEAPQLLDSQTAAAKPKAEPEVDEDGFTVVKSKGKSHR